VFSAFLQFQSVTNLDSHRLMNRCTCIILTPSSAATNLAVISRRICHVGNCEPFVAQR
jgi:hypothetical protein